MARRASKRKRLLKEPDQFITFSKKLIDFGRSHKKALLIGGVAVLALVAAGISALQISVHNEKKASTLVEKAVAKYSAALKATNPKTAYQRVKPDFNHIFKQYSSEKAVRIARIVYGNICYKAGDADQAISMYTRALDDFGQSKALKPLLLSGLGHAYMLKKEYPQALRYFKMITADNEKTLKSDALFNLAWLYEKAGDKKKSTAAYEQLLTDFPDSLYSQLAKEKVSG
jgi:tetratricopeptide (TPR) repeat protein